MSQSSSRGWDPIILALLTGLLIICLNAYTLGIVSTLDLKFKKNTRLCIYRKKTISYYAAMNIKLQKQLRENSWDRLAWDTAGTPERVKIVLPIIEEK